MLSFVQELCLDRDTRMGFDERCKFFSDMICIAGIALLFANCVLNLTQKCLGVISKLDLASQQH